MTSLAILLVAHLVGDFLLQNDWMQAKGRSTFACSVHVAMYSVPFVALLFAGALPPWAFALIIAQHWIQDRFSLHLKWMSLYGQTPPDKWPVGPLCVDQSMHAAWIGVVYLMATM